MNNARRPRTNRDRAKRNRLIQATVDDDSGT